VNFSSVEIREDSLILAVLRSESVKELLLHTSLGTTALNNIRVMRRASIYRLDMASVNHIIRIKNFVLVYDDSLN
jgi:hypothetical protein